MKTFYTMIVSVDNTAKLEKLFNAFRIDLRNWDRSKIFNVQGINVVNYTILCTKEEYESILDIMRS